MYISTRPNSHLETCREIVKNNAVTSGRIKACYVEKPVGRCSAETMEIVWLMKEVGVSLYTAYVSGAYEKTRTIKQLLQQGEVARIICILFRNSVACTFFTQVYKSKWVIRRRKYLDEMGVC